MANSAAVLWAAAVLESCALPAAAHCCRLASEVMDVRAGAYGPAAEPDDGYVEPEGARWSYSHAETSGDRTTVSSYREYHSYHGVTYLTWAGKTVVDEGGYDAREDRYGGGAVEGGPMTGGPGCPQAGGGARVIRCRYIPFEQYAQPASDEITGLDIETDGGVGGFVSGGGGGGGGGVVMVNGLGMGGAFAGSHATSRAFASTSASASTSIGIQMHTQSGGGGGWSGGMGGGHSSGGGGRW